MMKKYFTGLLVIMCAAALQAQQPSARDVLEKTATAFRQAGGIRAVFTAKTYDRQRLLGEAEGVIQLQGEKFVLTTEEAVTWFDGKTQWSYLNDAEEVNISHPTTEELQSINPYAVLSLYQQGYTHQLGTTSLYAGKAVYEVILTATDRRKDPTKLVLYIDRQNYHPLYIQLWQRDQTWSEIVLTDYRTGQKFSDSIFTFDRKRYPNAEVIDLR